MAFHAVHARAKCACAQFMVMRYLIGVGDELPPLRYRLLPASAFTNMPFYEQRLAAGQRSVSEVVAVHCGHLSGGEEKLRSLQRTGLLQRGLLWLERVARARDADPAIHKVRGGGTR